ncbi:MAG: hypothetical protein Q9196_005806 [Gyalolechia fulgens]
MAPRRGGGGGYSGGGGSNGISDTPWGETYQLSGAPFSDPYSTATAVFDGIGTLGFVVIIIWAMSSKLPRQPGSKLFRWFAFWLSAIALFVVFAIRFATDIMFGVEAVVQRIFFLIFVILSQSESLAMISLLGVLYLLLPHCSHQLARLRNHPRIWKSLRAAHATFIFILVALWLPSMALQIKYQVDAVIGDPYEFYTEAQDKMLRPYQKLDTTLAIMYFFGTLEISAWSVLAFLDVKKRRENVGLQLILLSMIAGPLLLRSTYLMGLTIYLKLQQHPRNRRLSLATDIIFAIASLLVYSGIVAIGRLLAKTDQSPYDPDHINPSYDPKFWGRNGNQGPNLDPKNQMAVHETTPPVYQQGGYYPMPQQQGGYPVPTHHDHGSMPYAPQHQSHMQYQQPQPYPDQPHHQQPYQNNIGPRQYQQQPYQNPGSPQFSQPQQNRAMRQGGATPSEVNGSSVSELSSPTRTHTR